MTRQGDSVASNQSLSQLELRIHSHRTQRRRSSPYGKSMSYHRSFQQQRMFGMMTMMMMMLLLVTVTVTMMVEGGMTNNNNLHSAVHTIPLIPHRVQKERRRQRLLQEQQQQQQQFSMKTTSTSGNIIEKESSTNTSMTDDDDHELDVKRMKRALEVLREHYPRKQLVPSQRLLRRILTNNNVNPDGSSLAQQIAVLMQGYGTHYADLWCGSPEAQRQTLIVDTGSGVTAFPCSACRNCGVPEYHIDQLFQESKSSTFRKLSCSECLRGTCSAYDKSHPNECVIGQAYQEGSSWHAYEALDVCYVGGLHTTPLTSQDNTQTQNQEDDLDPFHAPSFAFDFKFGCQTSLTGLFISQLADGIMGMDIASASLWSQMYQAHKISAQAFSLCFSRSNTAKRTGTEAGAMSLGGTDVRLHNTDMVYTDTSEGSGFYNVHLRAVYLRQGGGGDSAKSTRPSGDADEKIIKVDVSETLLNTGNVIVDSGTTDTYFTRSFGASFKQAWRAVYPKEYTQSGLKLTQAELDTFPTILIQLQGHEDENQKVLDGNPNAVGLAGDIDPDHPLDVILAIPPSHYFEYDDDVGLFVSRFYIDEGSGSVLGANAMMGHDVYFDIDNHKIGWAESLCDYTSLVTQYYPEAVVIPVGGGGGGNDQGDDDDDRIPEPEGNDDESATQDDALNGDDDIVEGGAGGDDDFENGDDETSSMEPFLDDDVGAIEGSDDEVKESGNLFCTSFSCQVVFVMLVVGLILLVGWRLWRSNRTSSIGIRGMSMYKAAAPSELELEETRGNGAAVAGVAGTMDYDTTYRDEPPETERPLQQIK